MQCQFILSHPSSCTFFSGVLSTSPDHATHAFTHLLAGVLPIIHIDALCGRDDDESAAGGGQEAQRTLEPARMFVLERRLKDGP